MFDPFYHGIIRKYVIVVGTLFNSIYINRTNSDGETVQTMRVPLGYGPKDKMLARLAADPDLLKPVAMTLPRIGFEMTGFQYDADRKLGSIQKLIKSTSVNNKMLYQYAPVPYNIQFEVSIMVKNADDGTRIVEQILPRFTPDWTSSVNLVPELGISFDVPLIIESVNLRDNYEGNFSERRAIVWTLLFNLKGYMFGPTNRSGSGGNVITLANTNFYTPTTNTAAQGVGITSVAENITITPGQDANGNPTSNSSITVDRNSIAADSEWDFIVDFESSIT